MRLLTHNFLQSNVRGTTKGYPLLIDAQEVVVEESPVDQELLLKLLPKLDYNVLRGAVQQLSSKVDDVTELPETIGELENADAVLLANLHKVLMDVHVLEGQLTCPDTGRHFPIKEGIPNMILHEDEV